MSVSSICGVIVVSDNPQALARFYGDALGLVFEEEDHGDLAIHYGVDLGTVHFGIHPATNFKDHPGRGGVAVAFAVSSVSDDLARCLERGASLVIEPHDEGFGPVATLSDPEGNLFELVELTYDFEPQAKE